MKFLSSKRKAFGINELNQLSGRQAREEPSQTEGCPVPRSENSHDGTNHRHVGQGLGTPFQEVSIRESEVRTHCRLKTMAGKQHVCRAPCGSPVPHHLVTTGHRDKTVVVPHPRELLCLGC